MNYAAAYKDGTLSVRQLWREGAIERARANNGQAFALVPVEDFDEAVLLLSVLRVRDGDHRAEALLNKLEGNE